MKYSDYVKFAPVNLTYEEWINKGDQKIKKQLEVRIETINTLIAAFGDEDGKLAKELNEVYEKLEKLKNREGRK